MGLSAVRPAVLVCIAALWTPAGAAVSVRALVIGNSLTAVNDLPGMVEAIARATGMDGEVRCAAVARPDFGLQEHWEDGEALREIRRGGWTHVILQQGPTSLPESRLVLIDYARRFAPAVREAGATLVFLSVWPPASRAAVQDAVTASYAAAAKDTRGLLVAAGEGWRLAMRADPSLALYGPDRFHPAPAGTYVAALMLFETLTGRSPRAVPSLPFTAEHMAVMHKAATAATANLAER